MVFRYPNCLWIGRGCEQYRAMVLWRWVFKTYDFTTNAQYTNSNHWIKQCYRYPVSGYDQKRKAAHTFLMCRSGDKLLFESDIDSTMEFYWCSDSIGDCRIGYHQCAVLLYPKGNFDWKSNFQFMEIRLVRRNHAVGADWFGTSINIVNFAHSNHGSMWGVGIFLHAFCGARRFLYRIYPKDVKQIFEKVGYEGGEILER